MGIHQFGHVSTEVQNFILKKYAAKYLRHIEKLQTWLDLNLISTCGNIFLRSQYYSLFLSFQEKIEQSSATNILLKKI